ncbi:transcription elongation factor GreA [Smithella sp. SC_K08D17]|jgi:transcription elongation factor GreA|nr:transcription elongation factor GreA [Smithella sp. D17]KIE17218.1 transcription elongation factor GreA [Smithella sp. SC_K08D17]MDD5525640.1 transcription elongation factor GreA [Smithella sp.]
MERIPITKAGFERLKKDLEIIKNISIPENVRDIETARAHGDISENAEYSAAKERQSFLYGKVQELEHQLAMANIINLKGLTTEKVVFGCYVSLEDIDSGEKISYQLLGPYESDINQNKISVTSPIGKALIGKKIGSEINVQTPGGIRNFEVIDISIE